MTLPILTLSDQYTDADESIISAGLSEFNVSKAGYRDWRPLAALLRDPDTRLRRSPVDPYRGSKLCALPARQQPRTR